MEEAGKAALSFEIFQAARSREVPRVQAQTPEGVAKTNECPERGSNTSRQPGNRPNNNPAVNNQGTGAATGVSVNQGGSSNAAQASAQGNSE